MVRRRFSYAPVCRRTYEYEIRRRTQNVDEPTDHRHLRIIVQGLSVFGGFGHVATRTRAEAHKLPVDGQNSRTNGDS